jgi:hypothetical protein
MAAVPQKGAFAAMWVEAEEFLVFTVAHLWHSIVVKLAE